MINYLKIERKKFLFETLAGKKAIPPPRLFNEKEGYVDRLNKGYAQKYENDLRALGKYLTPIMQSLCLMPDCIEVKK